MPEGGGSLFGCERAIGYEPVMLQGTDSCQPLVVAVVMDQRHIRSLGRRADQEVNWRDTTMVSVGGQQALQLACSLPKLCTHRDRLERLQAPGYLSCA